MLNVSADDKVFFEVMNEKEWDNDASDIDKLLNAQDFLRKQLGRLPTDKEIDDFLESKNVH